MIFHMHIYTVVNIHIHFPYTQKHYNERYSKEKIKKTNNKMITNIFKKTETL